MLLEDLGDNRDGRVDGVRNHEDERFGCALRDSSSEVANDTGIDLHDRDEHIDYDSHS